jgi:hypothetical protein
MHVLPDILGRIEMMPVSERGGGDAIWRKTGGRSALLCANRVHGRLWISWLVGVAFLLANGVANADVLETLPRYDLTIDLDTEHHEMQVRQLVTWTNCGRHPATELVFNAHSHYQVPDSEVGFLAKILEILRMSPTESIDGEAKPPLQIRRISLGAADLPFHYQEASSGPLVIEGSDGVDPAVPSNPGGGIAGKRAMQSPQVPSTHRGGGPGWGAGMAQSTIRSTPPQRSPKDERVSSSLPAGGGGSEERGTAARTYRAQADESLGTSDDCGTALVVPLPKPVQPGEKVSIEIDYFFRLPQKQGRWGQWQGVTFLCTWLPVLAVFEESGWHPTPFIPWHQPFFNEAGLYTARVKLPCDQTIACSAPIANTKDQGDGWKIVTFEPCCLRDWAFLCSARYCEYIEWAGPVQIRSVALPEHEHYARLMARWVCEAMPVYTRWFGPYPYPQFTIVESYFGWNGNECAGLVMIDERVYGMPHCAANFVEYLIGHEFCHQWWYNVVGTNGYCETWMDEGLATYFGHRFMDQKKGRNNCLITYPRGLEWMPNIRRDTYRSYSMYGTLARGEEGPTVQDMPKYKHLVNLLSMCYDRGGRIVGMIEDRLGETAFFDFMRLVYARYQFRILRVADFQHELEAYTGQSWKEFFDNWLYGAGLTDWCVEKVRVQPARDLVPNGIVNSNANLSLRGRRGPREARSYKITVLLHQKAEYNEPTCLGICLDNSDQYQIRLPINPYADVVELNEPPAVIRSLADNRVVVEVVLPCKPTQIAVDPDQILVDRNPANNYWKPPVHWRFTPLYTPLEETDVTTEYDKWNVIFGPGFFGNIYTDPWYTRSTVVGLRGALYRMAQLDVGAYTGYRTDYRDLVVGGDVTLYHWPWHNTQVGFNIEHSLTGIDDTDRPSDRGVLYGRYVIDYGSSLYLPQMQYVEAFTTIQDHPLPQPQPPEPGADHFDHQTAVGLHYHLDYLTPYWDPEGGFKFDATYANGIPVFGEKQAYERLDGQFSMVKGVPEWLGPLSRTRLAFRIYGGAALPLKGELFAMGGSELFRGFDLKERQGSVVWIGSVEWRIPLICQVKWDCCDHFVGIRNVYTAAFYDVGDCYVLSHSLGPVAHAVGAGLRIDVAWLSLIERTTLRFDVAKTVNESTGVQFWLGLQHPF